MFGVGEQVQTVTRPVIFDLEQMDWLVMAVKIISPAGEVIWLVFMK